MKALIKLSKITLMAVVLVFASCSDDDDNGPTTPTPTLTIVGTAQAETNLSSLVSALQKADESADNDLVSALDGDGTFTVFAPTNAAFDDLFAQLDGYSSLDDFDTKAEQDLLAIILKYHVISGNAAFSSDLSDGQTLNTLQEGATLQVSTQGGVFISDATNVDAEVIDADIPTTNGVVHVIDKVLLPQAILDALADIILVPITDLAIGNENLENLVAALTAANDDLPSVLRGDGPFTVLAPTDEAFEDFLDGQQISDIPVETLTNVLKNHVIDGALFKADLEAEGSGYTSTHATGAGDRNLSIFFNTGTDVEFNGVSKVVTADVKALNGVVHVVDAVIDLPNIVDHALANPDLSELVDALTEGGDTTYTDLFSSDDQVFTVFAPVNSAFMSFANPNDNDFDDILLNHTIVGTAAFRDGLTNSYVNTEAEFDEDENLSLYINVDNDQVTLNGVSTVAAADIVATNGVIHAVDAVIDLPTVVTFATADPNFSTLVEALTTLTPNTDFVTTLSAQDGDGDDPFTVFAPTNAAFDKLTAIPAEADLVPILQHHVIASANVRSGDLTEDGVTETDPTLEGDILSITLPGTGDNIADIEDGSGTTGIGIIAVDVQAYNGVIHVLDTVLIPDTEN